MAMIHDILASISGREHVFAADADEARLYHVLFGGIADNDTTFEAVILPGNTDELQAVVRAVTGHGYSLWSSPNAAGNGAVLGPAGKSAVIVDLQRLNRILEVNTHSACALVEPGVTYRQLHDYLQAKGIPLWVDSDRNPDHSIAGSICSRHYGYTPYGDHILMQCGMEVVLGNGELLRTGMGAVPGSDTWQLFKYNFGPYLDGLFTQSDMAVVSKIGLWLMPQPPVYRPFMITLPDEAALAAMVEALRPLKITGAIPNTVAISSRAFEVALNHKLEELGDNRPLDPAALKTITGVGEWNVFGALYGIADNVGLTWDAISEVFHRIPGAVVFEKQDRDGDGDRVWQRRSAMMGGRPAESSSPGMLDHSAGVNLTAAAPIEGEAAARMYDIVNSVADRHGVQKLIEYAIPSRTLLQQTYLLYGTDRNAAIAAAREIMQALTGAGYGLVDESLVLRRVADDYYEGTGLHDLTGRLRHAIYS
jgi:4-cresol dehydrogenase (hydroxylating)